MTTIILCLLTVGGGNCTVKEKQGKHAFRGSSTSSYIGEPSNHSMAVDRTNEN